jgi:hypothetical protein
MPLAAVHESGCGTNATTRHIRFNDRFRGNSGSPDAVFAQAAADRPSRFVRVMILPRALIGKGSIQYVNEADNAKPRVQQYKIFADAPIARPKE